ncbi:sialoadhesin-like isoform X2 [Channa argus]|uniref:sialoadhesin-like isoform X2 n=1 Tax=Channa argus TaxID=215402 RepID=UPI003520F712
MAGWDRENLCSFMFLMAGLVPGVVVQNVTYPDPVCAVKGSTVTLPCTFKPLGFITDSTGRHLLLQVIKVRWCQNHQICQGTTPSVYDSQSQNNNPRYEYLGDLKGNCTLQIRDLQKEDEATLRFRMEMNHIAGHFTEKSGVNVTVVDNTTLRINSSKNETQLRSGQTVSLLCTSTCSFHQLEVIWYRDDQALSESGPALCLGPLTAKDSGNYSCALKTNINTRSQPHSLFVNEVFDTVKHQILLSPLSDLSSSCTALAWLRSYLCGQTFKLFLSFLLDDFTVALASLLG